MDPTRPPSPGDSPPLPKSLEDLLNDGIKDLASRRGYRKFIVVASLITVTVFLFNLTVIICTLTTGFKEAFKPEIVAQSVVLELKKNINGVTSDKDVVSNSPQTSRQKTISDKDAAKEPIRVDAKIFGGIQDSMAPLVALVSILTIAVIVIIGTMLKAAFAPHPHHQPDASKAKDYASSPVPLIEALKGLVESLKGIFK